VPRAATNVAHGHGSSEDRSAHCRPLKTAEFSGYAQPSSNLAAPRKPE
jgi:hypothetical protein